mgnify:CR=1 FL=1
MQHIDPVYFPDMGIVGSHGQRILLQEFCIVAGEQYRPFMLLAAHCRISIDGNQWCALYGDNLQDGVAGFGDTPHKASIQFDVEWYNAKAGPVKEQR